MLRLKGQTESGEWVEFYPVDIVDTFEDEIKILLDKEIWVYADTIQPADDPADLMLDEVLRLLNEREPGEALEVFRKHFGLINTWQCKQCGATSTCCPLCCGRTMGCGVSKRFLSPACRIGISESHCPGI